MDRISKMTYMTKLRGADLTLAERAVLTTLWTYTNPDLTSAWPAKNRIAGDCGLSRDGVRKALRGLEAKGYIIAVTRGGWTEEGNRATSYDLTLPMGATEKPTPGDTEAHPGATEKPLPDPLHQILIPDPLPPSEASPGGDGDTSLRSHHAEHDAQALVDLAEAFYRTGDLDTLETFVEAYKALYGDGDTPLGHLTANCWGEDGTWDRIDAEVRKATMRGARDPIRYGAKTWTTKLHGITHGHLAA